VQTDRGALRGRAAIVTVSTGVLAAGGIAFTPDLPEPHRAAIDGLPMGVLTKVALALGPGAPELGPDAAVRRRVARSLEPGMTFLVRPLGASHVIGFVGGPAAQALGREGPAALEDFARSQWRDLFGARAELGPAVVADWSTDPWHRGAYAYARPGCAGARAALAAPLAEGTLAFAGEACRSDGLAGTVAGAWLDGVRAADAVDRISRAPGG